MGLVRAVTRGISRVNTQGYSDIQIASSALGISNAAVTAIGKGDIANTRKMAQVVPAISTPLNQTKAHQLGRSLGEVIRDGQTVDMIKKPVIAAAKAYVAAAKGRAEMATAVGGASQAVAQINSAAQHRLQEGHVQASFNTAISQAATKFAI